MCTIALAWQLFENAPVALAANRDESLDRPSEPPARRDWEANVLAPKDCEAEGTWIGYNEYGVLVAITNRWIDESIESDRSRGLLVRDALARESAEAAGRFVECDLDGRTYDGFNLLAVDSKSALLIEWDGTRQVTNLTPGVHVIVNGTNGASASPTRETAGRDQARNATALREHLQPEPGEVGTTWTQRAAEAIADHEYGVCLHRNGFGTRSSSLISMHRTGVSYEYADGPPCETPFEPVADTIDVPID